MKLIVALALVTANLAAIAAADPAFIHLKAFDLPPQARS